MRFGPLFLTLIACAQPAGACVAGATNFYVLDRVPTYRPTESEKRIFRVEPLAGPWPHAWASDWSGIPVRFERLADGGAPIAAVGELREVPTALTLGALDIRMTREDGTPYILKLPIKQRPIGSCERIAETPSAKYVVGKKIEVGGVRVIIPDRFQSTDAAPSEDR